MNDPGFFISKDKTNQRLLKMMNALINKSYLLIYLKNKSIVNICVFGNFDTISGM